MKFTLIRCDICGKSGDEVVVSLPTTGIDSTFEIPTDAGTVIAHVHIKSDDPIDLHPTCAFNQMCIIEEKRNASSEEERPASAEGN